MNTANRTLHLIDIENQLGTGDIKADEITKFMAFYKDVARVQETDHVIIAVSSSDGLLELAKAHTGPCRYLHKPGRDGADHELQNVMLLENIAERFDRIVLASGDGGFVDAVLALGQQDAYVTVIGRVGHISKRLQLVARPMIELPIYDPERLAA